jgi:hypothetical protein
MTKQRRRGAGPLRTGRGSPIQGSRAPGTRVQNHVLGECLGPASGAANGAALRARGSRAKPLEGLGRAILWLTHLGLGVRSCYGSGRPLGLVRE